MTVEAERSLELLSEQPEDQEQGDESSNAAVDDHESLTGNADDRLRVRGIAVRPSLRLDELAEPGG